MKDLRGMHGLGQPGIGATHLKRFKTGVLKIFLGNRKKAISDHNLAIELVDAPVDQVAIASANSASVHFFEKGFRKSIISAGVAIYSGSPVD
jgi:hypothetical protein